VSFDSEIRQEPDIEMKRISESGHLEGTEMSDTPQRMPQRAAGILALATAVAALALLANHPGGEAHSFADILANEAGNRLANAVVHGGFIVVLALQAICYVVLSARIGATRLAVVAALVLFAFGAAFLAASLVLDGLATPAVAAKYLAAPNKVDYAKSLFVLIGALVGVLMPIGLAFQSAAIACWGWALAASRLARIAGALALAMGGVGFAALAAGAVAMNPFVLMAVMAMTALWAALAGIVLLRAA